MKVVFIGAGNVATHLATELDKRAFEIVQIYSFTEKSAKALANKLGSAYTTDIKSVVADADLYIFSVKDSILPDLIQQVPSNNGIWIHTAGSMPIELFETYTRKYGVLYPFQTFSKDRSIDWKRIPIFIEASDAHILSTLKKIATKLSDNVIELSSEKRKYIHLTGVFACNFTNYMFTLSAEILKKINLPINIIQPLIDETCSKIQCLSPIDAQTGPAVRFDENVINKHLTLIEDEKTKELYGLISEMIYETHKKSNNEHYKL